MCTLGQGEIARDAGRRGGRRGGRTTAGWRRSTNETWRSRGEQQQHEEQEEEEEEEQEEEEVEVGLMTTMKKHRRQKMRRKVGCYYRGEPVTEAASRRVDRETRAEQQQ